jgi:hypothetical protein
MCDLRLRLISARYISLKAETVQGGYADSLIRSRISLAQEATVAVPPQVAQSAQRDSALFF